MCETCVAAVNAPDAHTSVFEKDHLCLNVCFTVLRNYKFESHLAQDPLAQEKDGPTKKLHVSFLMADHPD